MPIIHFRNRAPILPSVVGEHSIDGARVLESIPKIEPWKFLGLIRAARLYQDALWIAESEPNLAWLMFVSALETAAVTHIKENSSAVIRLEDWKPDLAAMLREKGGEDLVENVARIIVDLTGETKKFKNFALEFLPDVPAVRPEEKWRQIDWNKGSLSRILSKVYKYRSESLHSGQPFPAPMLNHAEMISGDGEVSELPLVGIATAQLGGVWEPADVPINLHCFHYLVRGTLLNWWKSMVPDGESGRQSGDSSPA